MIKDFIKNHPNIFRLTDIRYDIMTNLIRGNCISLIKKILYNKSDHYTSKINLKAMNAKTNDHLHFPRLYSWDSKSQKTSDLELAINLLLVYIGRKP